MTLAIVLLFATVLLNGQQSLVAAKLIEYDFTECVEVPSLHCKHGSVCTPGIASFGKQHDHLDLQTHESGYHCKCKAGYIGHQCETEVNECESKSGRLQSCYHGSQCHSSGGCDCNELNLNSGDTDAKFAGVMCQHESTSFCAASLVGTHSPNHQFCTNHGKCVKMVMGGETHPGCECADGWMGGHCEIRQDPFAKVKPQQGTNDDGGIPIAMILALILMGVVALVVFPLFVLMFIRARDKRNDAKSSEKLFEGPADNKATVYGDLDPDGSGTLGSPSKDRNADDNLEAESDASDDDDDSPAPQTEIV